MSGERDSYTWLALAARIWWATDDELDDGAEVWPMARVNAHGGVFSSPPRDSANEQIVACMFVLLLIWWWNCAKYRANLATFRAGYCKINAGRFFSDSVCIPHQLAVAAFSALALSSDKTSTSPHCANPIQAG